jgi:hypothetical protein
VDLAALEGSSAPATGTLRGWNAAETGGDDDRPGVEHGALAGDDAEPALIERRAPPALPDPKMELRVEGRDLLHQVVESAPCRYTPAAPGMS